jgi:hypothetical protein
MSRATGWDKRIENDGAAVAPLKQRDSRQPAGRVNDRQTIASESEFERWLMATLERERAVILHRTLAEP